MQRVCNAFFLVRRALVLIFAAKTKRYETICLVFCYSGSDGVHGLRGMGW